MCNFAAFRGMRGFTKPLILVLINKHFMIDKNVIKTAVEEWLEQNEYYLVDVEMKTKEKNVNLFY